MLHLAVYCGLVFLLGRLKNWRWGTNHNCPITNLNGPPGFQEVKAPRFLDIDPWMFQSYAPAAFTPGLIWYSFLEADSTPLHMEVSDATEIKTPGTPVIDPGTFRLVAQCLNHYAIPGSHKSQVLWEISLKNRWQQLWIILELCSAGDTECG